jgi:predicted ABC-type ATPase
VGDVKPVLLVVAGPNGAGKTTVTARLREERWSEGVEYLNPDDIARDRFGDWNSPDAVLAAARWTDARREELLAAGTGVAFETVLSTAAKIDFLARARRRGYFVRVFFIGTTDPTINAARVAGRVMEGGHSVPIDKIIHRYARSMANLAAAIRLADRAYVYDNSVDDEDARLCVRTQDGLLRKVYCDLPDWVEDAVHSLAPHNDLVDVRGRS